jgi:hypothetical protein
VAKANLTSIAAGAMSISASLLLIFTPELDAQSHWATKTLVTLIGAVSLYLVFAFIRWCLFLWHYRRLLGRWLYVTKASDGTTFRDENFAAMTFKLGFDGDLCYKVVLYPTIAGALKPGSEKRRGEARSLALNYDVVAETVELVFEVSFSQERAEDQTRKGRLSLSFTDKTLLEGDYVSQVWIDARNSRKLTISSGRMVATREIEKLRKLTGLPIAVAQANAAK